MLLKELSIENFGIYKGKHSIDLTVEDGKPVILFGGLNGGGKTTFLDALQLVLYGKHAKCSNRGILAYGTYLASTLNRFVDESETANLYPYNRNRQARIYCSQVMEVGKEPGEHQRQGYGYM